MLGAALQSVHIKDRLPERLAAKTAAPQRRLADCDRATLSQNCREANVWTDRAATAANDQWPMFKLQVAERLHKAVTGRRANVDHIALA